MVGHGNIGYGRANNLALRDVVADTVLVLNPDVVMAANCLSEALAHLRAHPRCAMVTPVSTDEFGVLQSLVKRAPDVITLALRGFAPAFMQAWFSARLQRYERAETPFDAPLDDAVIVSGCFMLMRRRAWVTAEGFDAAFFLYFEDFDLSRRIAAQPNAEIHRDPACRIVHGGGQASRKGWRHIVLFVRSAARFFGKHGW